MTTTCNPASAWGLFHNQTGILIAGIVLLSIIAYFWYTARDKKIRVGWSLVFLGGILNLGERIYHGCVTDYIKVVSWWPTFNIQDILIVIGLLIIILGGWDDYFFRRGLSGRSKKSNHSTPN